MLHSKRENDKVSYVTDLVARLVAKVCDCSAFFFVPFRVRSEATHGPTVVSLLYRACKVYFVHATYGIGESRPALAGQRTAPDATRGWAPRLSRLVSALALPVRNAEGQGGGGGKVFVSSIQ